MRQILEFYKLRLPQIMPNGLKVVICFLIYLRVVGPNLTLELSGACLTVNPSRTGFILVGDSQIKSIHSPPIFLPLQKI